MSSWTLLRCGSNSSLPSSPILSPLPFISVLCVFISLQGCTVPLETYFWPAELFCTEEDEEQGGGEEGEQDDEAEENESVDVSVLCIVCDTCTIDSLAFFVFSCWNSLKL